MQHLFFGRCHLSGRTWHVGVLLSRGGGGWMCVYIFLLQYIVSLSLWGWGWGGGGNVCIYIFITILYLSLSLYIYIYKPPYTTVLLEKKKYGGEGGGGGGGGGCAPSQSALGPRTDRWMTQNHAFNSFIRPDHEFCTWICPDRLLTEYAGVPLVTWIATNLSMPWISNYIHQFKLQ